MPANTAIFIPRQTESMSGIKDLAILMHWVDNSKQSTLEASLFKKRKVPRERQLILNDLKEETDRGSASASLKNGLSRQKDKMTR